MEVTSQLQTQHGERALALNRRLDFSKGVLGERRNEQVAFTGN